MVRGEVMSWLVGCGRSEKTRSGPYKKGAVYLVRSVFKLVRLLSFALMSPSKQDNPARAPMVHMFNTVFDGAYRRLADGLVASLDGFPAASAEPQWAPERHRLRLARAYVSGRGILFLTLSNRCTGSWCCSTKLARRRGQWSRCSWARGFRSTCGGRGPGSVWCRTGLRTVIISTRSSKRVICHGMGL